MTDKPRGAEWEEPSSGPLAGIRVVDLTRALAGPYCTLMLGDLGADVIKVENPDGGDETRVWGPPFQAGESSYFMSVNRNKRGITLDLKAPGDQLVLRRLIERADVLVENFRPGTMGRLGFAYEQARAWNPGLVYCSVSGFGQTGPRAEEPAYDAIIQGMGGFQSLTGEAGGVPMKVGVPVSDICAGMFAAFAISAALFARERDPGHAGQHIDCSMLGSQVAMLTYQAGRYFATEQPPSRAGNRHGTLAPYETFRTADGYVNIACGNEGIWQRFGGAMGLEDLLINPQYRTNADRLANRESLSARIQERFSSMTTEQALARLRPAGVPAGPVFDVAEVFADAQARHLGLSQPTPHPRVPELRTTGFPYHFSATPAAIRRPPPLLGQHNDEVLRELDA